MFDFSNKYVERRLIIINNDDDKINTINNNNVSDANNDYLIFQKRSRFLLTMNCFCNN